MPIGLFIIFLILVYTLAAIFAPGIRLRARGSRKKMGTVSAVGLALFFWGPALIFAGTMSGSISQDFEKVGFLLVILSVAVCIGGFYADSKR
jgi:hypothetical protein